MKEKEKDEILVAPDSDDAIIDKVADELLQKYLPAFEELAK